jgi:cysteine desulfurase
MSRATTPIYLDHQSTTPVDPRVLEEMLPWFSERFGNAASRSHVFGWKAEEAVENGRSEVAKLIGADAKEIVFTSGATESNNLAILGAAAAHGERGNHIVTTAIEHRAVLDPVAHLEKQGYTVTRVGVDKFGRVDPEEVRKAITYRTILVSAMFVNNEVGTIQPVAEIGKITREKGILFHCDAVQGIGKLPFDVREMNIDLASLSAHKLYGPKGVGALYVRRKPPRARIEPILFGGGHEKGLRSGTLNVPGIVGFGKACELYRLDNYEEAKRLALLRDRLHDGLKKRLEAIPLNGHLALRHPGNLNLSFAYVEGESLLMEMKQIAVSSGSACTSASLEPSHVLKAMGVSPDLAHAAIRFGIGRFNTEEEIDFTINYVAEVVNRLRERSPLYEMAKKGVNPKAAGWER